MAENETLRQEVDVLSIDRELVGRSRLSSHSVSG
jgi:hypothetical protein